MNRKTADKICSQCDQPGYRFRGERWLCIIHNRIDTMTCGAREKGKRIPSAEEFAAMISDLLARDMKCFHCQVVMVWAGRRGQANVVSLQHDRGGDIRFLCSLCNSRHQAFPGDTFYGYPLDWRWCPSCSSAKPLSGFFKQAKGKHGLAMSYCRVCRARFQREGFGKEAKQCA